MIDSELEQTQAILLYVLCDKAGIPRNRVVRPADDAPYLMLNDGGGQIRSDGHGGLDLWEPDGSTLRGINLSEGGVIALLRPSWL